MYKDRLKALRERIGLTQEQVGSLINIKRSQYCLYEKEKVTVPSKHLNTLCNYFNVSFDYIFEFTNTKKYKDYLEEIDYKKAGLRLKEFRKENKITQKELAKELNTTQSVIAGYETGNFLINTPFLYQICKNYKISADYLLGKIDKKINL